MAAQLFQSEIYRNVVLTVIALLLAFLLLRVETGKVRVIVRGGSIDVDNTVSVNVENDVKLDEPVKVEGTVEIAR